MEIDLSITLASGPILTPSKNSDGTYSITIANPADPMIATKQELSKMARNLMEIQQIDANVVVPS